MRLLGACFAWLSVATFQISFRALASPIFRGLSWILKLGKHAVQTCRSTSTKFSLAERSTTPNNVKTCQDSVLCTLPQPMAPLAVPAMKTIGRTCCLLDACPQMQSQVPECPIKPRTAKSWPYHVAVQGAIVRSSCTWPWPHLSECTRLPVDGHGDANLQAKAEV